MSRTDHSEKITSLRERADRLSQAHAGQDTRVALHVLTLRTAADLLEIHDNTGISLDSWDSARGLVETLIEEEITANRA